MINNSSRTYRTGAVYHRSRVACEFKCSFTSSDLGPKIALELGV